MLECLMLVMILGMVGVGTGQALLAVAKAPGQTNQQLTHETTVVSAMEYMRSIPYDYLETLAAQNSTTAVRITVAYADPSGGANTNSNFKKITVTSNGITLVTMVSKP